MAPNRFDDVPRALSLTPSRRGVGRMLGSLAAGAVLGVAGATETTARTCPPCRKKKDGRCKKKRPNGAPCGVCRTCKGGRCVPDDGSPCAAGGQICQDGRCACPGGTAECGGGCVDLTSDVRTCGSCTITCRAQDTCLHGGCAVTSCASPSPPGGCSGASCSGPTCAGGESCGTCDVTTEGQVTCVNLSPSCDELAGCDRSTDCALGEVCVTNGCCSFQGKPNICVRPV